MNWKRAVVWGAIAGWAWGYIMLLTGQYVGHAIQIGSFPHKILVAIHWPILGWAERFGTLVFVLIIVCYWILIGVVAALIGSKIVSLRRRDIA